MFFNVYQPSEIGSGGLNSSFTFSPRPGGFFIFLGLSLRADLTLPPL